MLDWVLCRLRKTKRDQKQQAGTGAVAFQAGGDVTVSIGMTYSQVREVALDVYRSNLQQLAGEARETARVRVEEITDQFLLRLREEFPDGLSKAQDPDFQHALYTVQKQYARSGNSDLGELLIDLLVDRSKQAQRDMLQIVLNESLNTISKLTDDNLATLALIFLFRHTQHPIGNHQQLGEFLDRYVAPFIDKVSTTPASYQHLQFTGCGSIQLGETSLETLLEGAYQGQFQKGFDSVEIQNRGLTIGLDPRFFTICLNDPTKVQVIANNRSVLDGLLTEHLLSPDDHRKINELFELGKMSSVEIREKCVALRPYMEPFFNTWSGTHLKNFTLTSVGMAIGHANLKRVVGDFAPLSIWIN